MGGGGVGAPNCKRKIERVCRVEGESVISKKGKPRKEGDLGWVGAVKKKKNHNRRTTPSSAHEKHNSPKKRGDPQSLKQRADNTGC